MCFKGICESRISLRQSLLWNVLFTMLEKLFLHNTVVQILVNNWSKDHVSMKSTCGCFYLIFCGNVRMYLTINETNFTPVSSGTFLESFVL